jgi:hypothetical protein
MERIESEFYAPCLLSNLQLTPLLSFRGYSEDYRRQPCLHATPYDFASVHFVNILICAMTAYGKYNNLVLDASGARGQSVVIWDFE